MSDEESLASVLGGSSAFHEPVKAEAPKQETAEAPKQEPAPEARARDESGKFAKEPEKAVEAKADPKVEKPDEPVHVAAIIDERRKRQALERKLAELEQRLQPQQEPKPPPSVFEDEDGAINQRVEATITPLRQGFVDQSVTLAKILHKEDWNEAEAGFIEAAEANPELWQRYWNAKNPGEFAYEAGMYHREMSKYGGSVVAMQKAIRGETAKELTEAKALVGALQKELAELKATKAEAAEVTKSLNTKASGTVNAETQTDDDDLKTIVRFGNK